MSHYCEGKAPSAESITEVVAEVIAALDDAEVPYLLMGGAVATTFARPRLTDDIDVFVEPGDAERALAVLAKAGFTTEQTDPSWIYKAMRSGVLVDVIFRSAGGVYLDGGDARAGPALRVPRDSSAADEPRGPARDQGHGGDRADAPPLVRRTCPDLPL